MQPTVAGVVQMNSGDDLAQNLECTRKLVALAVERGARLVVLPENFAFMGLEGEKTRVAESESSGGPIHDTLRELASRHAIELIAGGFPEISPDAKRPYNTALVFDPSGAIVARYRKIHLFDVDLADASKYRESSGTTAGSEIVAVDLASARLGLSICYDLRFPELYRELTRRGSEVLVVPAAFTQTTGRAHWHVLLRARAVESGAFVLAAAQSGSHPGKRTTYGHALIVDPWGTVLAECEDGEGVAVAELDPKRLEAARSAIPLARHHKI
jgi:deaminated glutathione amidase